jgi:hypothetical protein
MHILLLVMGLLRLLVAGLLVMVRLLRLLIAGLLLMRLLVVMRLLWLLLMVCLLWLPIAGLLRLLRLSCRLPSGILSRGLQHCSACLAFGCLESLRVSAICAKFHSSSLFSHFLPLILNILRFS